MTNRMTHFHSELFLLLSEWLLRFSIRLCVRAFFTRILIFVCVKEILMTIPFISDSVRIKKSFDFLPSETKDRERENRKKQNDKQRSSAINLLLLLFG